MRSQALAFDESYRIIAADMTLHPMLVGLTDPADVDTLRAVIALTGVDEAHAVGNPGLVPSEDRPSGPGSAWALLAFTRPGRRSRFSDGSRGIWYGAEALATCVVEVGFHTARRLRERGEPSQTLPKRILRAQLVGTGVDLRRLSGRAYAQIHDPDPAHYAHAQAFAATRHAHGDDLLVYHSVRAEPPKTHACLAVLRPRAIRNAQPRFTFSYKWDGRTLIAGPVAPPA